MNKIKSNILTLCTVILITFLGITTMKFMNNVYEIELSNQQQEVEQHLEYVQSLE